MKRLCIILTLIVSAAGGVYAQVIIGASENAKFHEAAMLELKPEGDRGGLLMPLVALSSATLWEPLLGKPTNGMTVYNTFDTKQNGLSGKGIYVWTDGRWYPTITEPCSAPPRQPVLEVKGLNTNNNTSVYQPFMAYVSNPEPFTSYVWDLPAGLIGHSATNVITIVGNKAGTYTIKAHATNECGSSSETSYTLTISPPFALPPNRDGTGSVTIQGITCYDIAQTEGSGCGSLNSRRPAFRNASQRTRNYLLSLTFSSNLSNLRVGTVDDTNGIIASVSGDVPGPLNRSEYPITVVFADNINDIILRKGKSSAKLCAVYQQGTGNNAVDKYVTLTISVQDCSCCPLNEAYVLANAAYKGSDIYDKNLGLGKLLNTFTQIPGAALCVFRVDQGNSAPTGNSWSYATNYCSQVMVRSYGEGWRLPNLAELYYKLHPSPSFGWSKNNQGRYFASTLKKGSSSASRNYLYTYMPNSSQNISLQEVQGTVTTIHASFRCVKTINY